MEEVVEGGAVQNCGDSFANGTDVWTCSVKENIIDAGLNDERRNTEDLMSKTRLFDAFFPSQTSCTMEGASGEQIEVKGMPKVTPPFCRVDDKLLTTNVDCY
jgi:hypothetical protein